jgi:hypothetical protein
MEKVFNQIPSEVVAMYNIELLEEGRGIRIKHPVWISVYEGMLDESREGGVRVSERSVEIFCHNASISMSRKFTDMQVILF